MTPARNKWKEVYDKVLKSLEEVGNLRVVKYQPTMDPIPFREVLVNASDPILKEKRYKARLTARGDLLDDPQSYYSRVVPSEAIKVFLAMAIGRKPHIRQGDISTAYLYDGLSQPIHLWLPTGHVL